MAHRYQIKIEGELDGDWSNWFEDMHMQADTSGTTTLTGNIRDQAALHGLMTKFRDLGLKIQLIKQIDNPNMGGSSMAFIEIRNLSKTFATPAGPLNVLRGIDLDIQAGDFVALIGPSGAGKTTFLNMITGIDRPTEGDVIVGGLNVTQAPQRKLTRWRARNVGIVFQFFQLLPTLSVANNVIAPMDFGKVWQPADRHGKAVDLLTRFGIGDQALKTPDMLSGGQQQRVALARALANNPPLIVGDEPTGNLDRMSARTVFDTFHALSQQGSTVIIVTHDRELVRGVPKILELNDGIIGQTTLAAAARRRTQELRALRLSSQPA